MFLEAGNETVNSSETVWENVQKEGNFFPFQIHSHPLIFMGTPFREFH